jgi:hypothetical protein
LVEANLILSNNKYKQDEIIQMLDFLIDKIFVLFCGRVFQQTIGIPMGTKCASLLADLFLHDYQATSFKGFSRIKRENYPRPLIPASTI